MCVSRCLCGCTRTSSKKQYQKVFFIAYNTSIFLLWRSASPSSWRSLVRWRISTLTPAGTSVSDTLPSKMRKHPGDGGCWWPAAKRRGCDSWVVNPAFICSWLIKSFPSQQARGVFELLERMTWGVADDHQSNKTPVKVSSCRHSKFGHGNVVLCKQFWGTLPGQLQVVPTQSRTDRTVLARLWRCRHVQEHALPVETSEQVSCPVFMTLQQIACESSKLYTDADGRKLCKLPSQPGFFLFQKKGTRALFATVDTVQKKCHERSCFVWERENITPKRY